MDDNTPILYLPNGQRVTKAADENGKGQRAQFGPFVIWRSDLKGAEPKQAPWRQYYEMYANHPWVYAAINKIVKVATNTGYDFVPRDSRSEVLKGEYEIAKGFFGNQSNFIGELRRVYRDLLIYGDAYMYVVPNRRRKPVRLKRLAPWTMHIKARKNGKIDFYVQKDPYKPNEDAIHFDPKEILHFKLDDPSNDLYGLSPLEVLKTVVSTDLFAMDFNKKFFQNGAATGTVVIVEDATIDELERNKKWLQEEYVGTQNAHKPIILAGKIKLERGIATHSEMGFLEGCEYLKKMILAVLDVPPAKLGDMETANRSNSREQDKTFRSESVSPLQNQVENVVADDFMRDILGLRETIFKHSESDVRDAMEQAELNGEYLDRGVIAINEVRATLGKADVEGGDIPTIMTATGAVPVDRLDLYFQIPRTNSEDVPLQPDSPESESPNDLPNSRRTGAAPATVRSIAAEAVEAWLAKADDPKALRRAYAYALDAAQADRYWLWDHTVVAIKKALDTDDRHTKTAFIERAEEFVARLRDEVGNGTTA